LRPYLIAHKFKKRIVIQPTSSDKMKNWSPKKFLKLAKILQKNGWEPLFCVAPGEYQEWQQIVKNKFSLQKFPDLAQLAAFIYESGYMIGNDSGVGHLASALGIPTLTIIKRIRKFYRWRPGWGIGRVICPLFKLPIYHDFFWQYLVSPKRVFREFNRLVKECNNMSLMSPFE
jgi:heptosyltransferase-3